MSSQGKAQAQLKIRIAVGETAHWNFQFDRLKAELYSRSLRMRPNANSHQQGSIQPYRGGNMYDSSMSARSLLSAAITFNKSLTESIP